MPTKAKTYRVEAELAKAACEKMIEYITNNQEPVTEAQIVNVSIAKGLQTLTDEEIKEYLEKKD